MPEDGYLIEDVNRILSYGKHKVVFYKTDGSIREMVCTKDMNLVPVDKAPGSTKSRMKSDTTVPVYSIEDNGWRSFIMENLISIESVE